MLAIVAGASVASSVYIRMFSPTKRLFIGALVALLAACAKSSDSQSQSPPTTQSTTTEASSDIPKNETTLPTYPHLAKATMLSNPNPENGCIEYMSSTNDSLDDALAWYRSKLSGAKETPFQGDYKGVDFTVNGTDHVMVFVLGMTGTSITLRHSTGGKSCGRADGRAG
jgi:hypothetical protein